jgi:peptidoglycan/LPS O-acetylase OafA/YrhL
VLVMAMTGGGAWPARLLVHRPVLFVGRTSYSIYLYHVPLLLAWNHFRILEGRWLAAPAYIATVLAIAWLSWEFVERRFIEAPRPGPIIAP